jgi:hypothetical protein
MRMNKERKHTPEEDLMIKKALKIPGSVLLCDPDQLEEMVKRKKNDFTKGIRGHVYATKDTFRIWYEEVDIKDVEKKE